MYIKGWRARKVQLETIYLLCLPLERSSPFTDPVVPVLSNSYSVLQWDVTISATGFKLSLDRTLINIGVSVN